MWEFLSISGLGVLQTFCMWMCLPDFKILTFAIPIFVPIYHPSVHQFRKKKNTLFWSNWVLFTKICSKYTQFTYTGAFLCDKKSLILSKFAKSTQMAGTYTYTMSMWEPPLPRKYSSTPFISPSNQCQYLMSNLKLAASVLWPSAPKVWIHPRTLSHLKFPATANPWPLKSLTIF